MPTLPLPLTINNCNNIDSASISLLTNQLNIKLGANGTGKSTIAKAITTQCDDEANLKDLMPFKLRADNPNEFSPEVNGLDEITSVMTFNEAYVDQFVFHADELLKNSFDIFIQTDSYKEKTAEIERLVSGIKQVYSNNPELENFLTDLKVLSSNFKLSRNGLARTSPVLKGLKGGNKLEHIPAGLEPYTPFLRSEKNVTWIDWQIKGHSFIDDNECCPFCTTSTTETIEQIRQIGEEYDKTAIKHLAGFIGILSKLGGCFSPDAKSNLDAIISSPQELQPEQEQFLIEIKGQMDVLVSKLEDLKNLSSVHFGANERVSDKLPQFRIDLTLLAHLNSEVSNQTVANLNTSLDAVIDQEGQLQGQINQQRHEASRLIERHQTDINQFLSNAGYDYSVYIEVNGDDYKLKLKHNDFDENISGGNQHLSYGERNAFALVLFMYECLSKQPDLVILDDPISSFDKNKKYAIMDMLFRQEECLKNKTVLMLTHDIEPIIDMVKALWRIFNQQTAASFLRSNNGVVVETEITRGDLLTFSQICRNVISSATNSLVKLVYLRRWNEILDDRSNAYQVLSNLLHKRTIEDATDTRTAPINGNGHPLMDQTSFTNGVQVIRQELADFDYALELANLLDRNHIINCYNQCSNGYEKLQLFRILEGDYANAVIRKFINEAYHVENEFICQLDPSRFDMVPQFVIDECDNHVGDQEAVAV